MKPLPAPAANVPQPPNQSGQSLRPPPDAHQFLLELSELWAAPDDARDARMAGLRRVQTFLAADAICLALYDHFSGRFDLSVRLGRYPWPAELWPQVLAAGRAPAQSGLLAVPAAAAGQTAIGVLAVARPAAAFSAREQRVLRRVGALLAHAHEARRLRVLMRIMQEANHKERPIDLYRFLLDELQRFVRYDHSAAVIVLDRENNGLIVRQELVTPGAEADRLPSPRASSLTPGLAQSLTDGRRELAASDSYYAFHRAEQGGPWQGQTTLWLASALAYGELPWRKDSKDETAARSAEAEEAPAVPFSQEGGILAVPLVTNDTLWGLLKLSTRRCGPLHLPAADQQMVQHFASRLALTLYESDRYYRRQLEMEAVRAIGQTTTHPVSLEAVCQTTLEAALKTLNLNVGQVQTRLRLVDGQPVQARSVRARDVIPQPFADFETNVWRSAEPGLHNNLPPPAAAPPGSRVMRAVLIMPIQYEHTVIGLISVQSSLAERFRQTDRDFLQTVAHEAALALKTAQLYEQLRQEAEERRKRLALLHELSRALSRQLDLQAILRDAVATSRTRLHAETASIFLLKDGVFQRQGSDGQDDAVFPDETYRVGEGLTGLTRGPQAPQHPDRCPLRALPGSAPAPGREQHEPAPAAVPDIGAHRGLAVVCNHVNDCPLVIEAHRQRYRQILPSGQVQHLIAVPLDDAYRTFGVLRVLNKMTPEGALDASGFSDDDRDLLSTIASQVATAISNLRQTQRLTSIFEVNELISQTFDRVQIGSRIADIMTGPAVGYSQCTLHLLEGNKLTLIPTHGRQAGNRAALEIGLDEGVVGWVAREKRYRYVPDIAQDADFKHKNWAARHGLVSMLCVPLLTGSEVFGALAVYTAYRYQFNDDEIRALHTFATQAAIALANARKQQQLTQAFDVRTEELYRASHELRSPLANARQITDILLAGKVGPLTAKQHDRLGKLADNLKRQQRQIEQLLLVSKLEAADNYPAMPLETERLNVLDLLRQARRRALRRAQGEGLRLSVTRPADPGLTVLGDRHALEQVLDNLIENALKFTPAGGAIVLGQEAWHEWIRITVSDTGVGIPDELHARVFEKFFQIESVQQRQKSGLGLGLYICRELLQRQGGEIELRNTPGGGATFTILLPQ